MPRGRDVFIQRLDSMMNAFHTYAGDDECGLWMHFVTIDSEDESNHVQDEETLIKISF